MYLGWTIENFISIGLMLLVWMLAVHVIGQFGVQVSSLWGGSN